MLGGNLRSNVLRVPTTVQVRTYSTSTNEEILKSVSLGTGASGGSPNRILGGLMSRWMMPVAWTTDRPCAIPAPIRQTSEGDNGPWLRIAARRSPPTTSSITMPRVSPSMTSSWTSTRFSPRRASKMERSRTKRSTTSMSVASSAWRSLKARRFPSLSVPRKASPMAPRPMLSPSMYLLPSARHMKTLHQRGYHGGQHAASHRETAFLPPIKFPQCELLQITPQHVAWQCAFPRLIQSLVHH